MLFRNGTHQEAWRQRWCETCFQPDEASRRLHGKDAVCPIWERAIRSDRKPPEWDRKPRADEMWLTIKCNGYSDRPAVVRRKTAEPVDVPMFEVEPVCRCAGHVDEDNCPRHGKGSPFVPVEGWPDKGFKGGVDHA